MSNKSYKDAEGATFTVNPRILLEAPYEVEEYNVLEGTEIIGEKSTSSSQGKISACKLWI